MFDLESFLMLYVCISYVECGEKVCYRNFNFHMKKYEVLTCVQNRKNEVKHENKVIVVLLCEFGSL